MKKTLSIALVLMLIAALATPAVAFAAKGGKGSKGAERAAAAREAKGSEAGRAEAPGQAKKQLKAQKKDKAPAASEAASETPDGDASAEETVTMSPGKQKGITNALTRIHANLTRMQADVDAGLRTQLPPGLLRVFEKFFGWLGDAAPPLDTPWVTSETTPAVDASGTVGPDETAETSDTAGVTLAPLPQSDAIGSPLPLPDPLPFV